MSEITYCIGYDMGIGRWTAHPLGGGGRPDDHLV